MFCVACCTFNTWCSCPFKLSLFLKTNMRWHLLQLLSSGTAILTVFATSTHDLISSLIWKYPPSSRFSLTAVFDLTPISAHTVQSQNSAHLAKGVLSQMRGVSSITEWKTPKASITCPNRSPPSFPIQVCLNAKTQPWEWNFPMTISLRGWKDWLIDFAIHLVENTVWKFMYLGDVLLRCAWRAKRFLKANRY